MAQKCRFPQDYDTVRPYTPVEILENGTASTFRFGILNRNISVSKMGLPDAIAVARPQTQHGTLPAKVSNLLLSPFKLLVVPTGGGAALTFEPTESPQVRRDGDGKVRKTPSFAPLYKTKVKVVFYQDRLGTNTGKTPKKVAFSLGVLVRTLVCDIQRGCERCCQRQHVPRNGRLHGG